MAKLTSNGVTIEGTPEELAVIMERFSTKDDVVESQFKEGDVVRVLTDGQFNDIDEGAIGTILDNDAGDGFDDPYTIAVGSYGDEDYFRPQDIELVSEEEAEADAVKRKRTEVFTSNGRKVNEYREGDIVQITDVTTSVNSVGDIGEVSETANDGTVRIQVNGNDSRGNWSTDDCVKPLVFVEDRLDRK